jgi:hypothetical protein
LSPSPKAKTFPSDVALAIDAAKYFYLRAGAEHRFIAVWVLMIGERVFVRSWNDKPGGWYRAFRDEGVGTIKVETREIGVRAKPVRSAKLLDQMDVAYAQKYDTKANLKYVKGFTTAKRRACSLELTPL